jgi:hypothetical protein
VKDSSPESQRRSRQARSEARVYALPQPPKESPLMPQDFDRALRRMKNDLALIALKRQILDPGLDAKTVLSLVDQIEGIQS